MNWEAVARLRHSLRTPLHHISGYAEMVEEEATERDARAPVELMQKVKTAARRILESIQVALAGEDRITDTDIDDLRRAICLNLDEIAAATDAFDRETRGVFASDLSKIRGASDDLRDFARRGRVPTLDRKPAGGTAAPVRASIPARILAVDDDEINREILTRQLQREGFSPVTEADGKSALARLRTEHFDLILLDLFMPGMDGFQVLSVLKADPGLSQVPVIVMSALNDVENAVRSIEMGAEDFLGKPFDPVLLRARIGAIVRRREAETERAKLAGHLELLLESAGGGVYGTDPEGICTFINRAALSMLGYRREELLGRSLHEIIHHTHPDGTPYPLNECPIYCVLATGEPQRGTAEALIRADGTMFPVEYSAHPICRDGKVQGVVVTFEDISERKRAEEHLLLSAKLESLGVLAGGLAHDFNNILTGILGNSSLVMDSLAASDPNLELIRQVVIASERAADLTRQMLAFAGKGRFVIEAVDLSQAILDIRELLESSMPKRVGFILQLERGLPRVDADLRQLQQLIVNLVINAGEAVEDRPGVVQVETGTRTVTGEEPAEPPFGPLPAGQYVFVAVQDSGVGMDAATRARIFDPFFSTKFTGRGLGLAAAMGIARAHGGVIRVTTEPGQGSRFECLLPAQAAQRMVLVVDDEEIIRSTTRAVLERRGFRVLVAEDGQQAVDLFRKHAQEISLVLLDLTMPVMSGDEAARYLHTIRPDVPILVSSGYNESDVARRLGGNRVAGFVRKPYTAAALLQKIEGALK